MHPNNMYYNPMGYPPEGMMPQQGYMMGYADPSMQMQGYMGPGDQMQRVDRGQGGYGMKKSYPRGQSYGGYSRGGGQHRGRGSGRGGYRGGGEGYAPKYGERKFRQGYAYGEEGEDDSFSQSKLAPQSKKISKYPKHQDRRFEGSRPSYYDDQMQMGQDYYESGKPTRGESSDDHKGLNPTMFFKTKMCPHLSDCTRGPTCSYAHNQSELRNQPNLKKTRLCQQYMNGKCQRGGSCSFAHGEEELRATPEFFKTSLCHSYMKGHCKAGEHCRYAHGDDELRAQTGKGQEYPEVQPYEQQMYRPQSYLNEYDLSAYQMEQGGLDMGNKVNETLNANPLDPNVNKKSEIVPQNAYVSNNFNDYMHNNSSSRNTSANKPAVQQAENPDNIAFNTFNPEKINSLLGSNQNQSQNGNF